MNVVDFIGKLVNLCSANVLLETNQIITSNTAYSIPHKIEVVVTSDDGHIMTNSPCLLRFLGEGEVAESEFLSAGNVKVAIEPIDCILINMQSNRHLKVVTIDIEVDILRDINADVSIVTDRAGVDVIRFHNCLLFVVLLFVKDKWWYQGKQCDFPMLLYCVFVLFYR